MSDRVLNIVVAGLGGQGVLKASDILAEAAFAAGWDVKQADVHGMSQRGGSVRSDIRFGPRVFSPMVTAGEADFLVVLAEDQVQPHRDVLKPVDAGTDCDGSAAQSPQHQRGVARRAEPRTGHRAAILARGHPQQFPRKPACRQPESL
jgi:Pyruvate/2-oxoacid:ferredoxin oxidoreductase gamma subunit